MILPIEEVDQQLIICKKKKGCCTSSALSIVCYGRTDNDIALCIVSF